MNSFFKLEKYGSNVSTEVLAGVTTFFAMSYIIIVNPNMLAQTGIPWGAVYLATILSAVISTLIMGLFANVPYALAPGMGLNAFFTYTVCFGLGFTWQQALGMVFLCGLFNIFITITKIRKQIIKSIPLELQHAVGAGIGIFISYIGVKNAGLLKFTLDPGNYEMLGETVVGNASAVPELVTFNNPGVLLALIGLVITVILLIKNVKGAILIGIVATTLIGIPMGVVNLKAMSDSISVSEAFSQLGTTVGVAVGKEGLLSLFSEPAKIPLVLMTVFAFSLSDVFDTIGTFIGTGIKSGIFTKEDEKLMEESVGYKTRLDRAMFADSIGTSIGAILGTSNTTTFVESAAGIGAGGRTGLTAVSTSVMFLLSIFLAPVAKLVPAQATSAALIVVGIMMLSSFTEIEWDNLEVAIPAFFTAIFMGFVYSISYGMAFGFIFYVLVKLITGKIKEVHPILLISTLLFIVNFLILIKI